jgi:hypothetical protein
MHGLNGSGRAPKALTLAKAKELGLCDGGRTIIPFSSIHSCV